MNAYDALVATTNSPRVWMDIRRSDVNVEMLSNVGDVCLIRFNFPGRPTGYRVFVLGDRSTYRCFEDYDEACTEFMGMVAEHA